MNPTDVFWIVTGLVLFAESERIITFFERRNARSAPITRLILSFISLGSIVIGFPPMLLSNKIDLLWFFPPFGYLLFRYIQGFITDFRSISTPAYRSIHATVFISSAYILGVLAWFIATIAPIFRVA
jgi:hypothetical protein